MKEKYAELSKRADVQLKKLNALIQTQVPALNKIAGAQVNEAIQIE
jgi:hypothetical protein